MKTKNLLFALLCVSFAVLSCGTKSSSQRDGEESQAPMADTLQLSFLTLHEEHPYEVFLNDGKVSLCLPLATRQMLTLGDKIYLPEEGQDANSGDLFDVTRLAAPCVKIFVGDIGQDTNPMLCMLLNDGRVQLLSIIEAVRYRDFNASAPIKQLQNIKSFQSKVVDNSYVTIFAKDAAGKEFEIRPFMVKHELEYPVLDEVGNPRLVIILTPDYKIQLLMDRYEGSWGQIYKGSFEGPDWLDEGETGNYNFKLYSARFEDDMGIETQEIDEIGGFSLTPKGEIQSSIELTSAKIAAWCNVNATQTYK